MLREGYEAIHVKDLNLVPSEDYEIRKYALREGYVVISKDDDFAAYASEPASELKVVWVRTGNCKNKKLIDVLLVNLPVCMELFSSGNSLVEISFE